MMVSLRQDKRYVFDKVLDLLVAMLCCECRGRSLNLSSLFCATMCFLGATLRGLEGLGGQSPQDGGPGGQEPPRKFQPLSLSFDDQKHQNSVAAGMGVISTNDIVSALVP